jgi:hypothetical protein
MPYGDREAFLEMVNRQAKETDQIELLRGFARSSPQAADWLLDGIRRGDLQGTVAERTRQEAVTAIQKGSGADLELRVNAMVDAPGKAGVSREGLATELLGEDVLGVLKDGRDWRYEFRHGAASADEVLAAMRAALPAAAQAGDASLRKALFRHLVEEDPVQAKPLIEPLAPEAKRALEYDVLQRGFAKTSPELFSGYLSSLPAAKTPEEQKLLSEALLGKAAAYAGRFGDNYQQAVKAMAAGRDREAAVEGIVQETRRKNAARASEVEQQLSPKDP